MTEPMDTTQALHDPARLDALEKSCLIDSAPEESFDRLTRLAAKLIHTPIAMVSLVDDNHQFMKSQVGLPELWASTRQAPLTHSFCQYVVASGQPLIVDNAPAHALVCNNLAIREMGVAAYAGIPLITDKGHVLGSFCVIDTKPRVWTQDELDMLKDLAASVMTEIELHIKVNELAEQNHTLDTFAQTAAHDLKAPLGLITGYADLLKMNYEELPTEKLPTDDTVEYVNNIQKYCDKMRRMVDELLFFAQVGQDQVKTEPLVMKLSLIEAVDRLSGVIAQASAELVMPDTLPMAMGYGPWVEEVWANYINNAVKYGGNPPHIEIGATQLEHRIRFWVKDNGTGLTNEQQRLLFRPFTRLHSRDIEGQGLGLSIVRRIVEKLDGEVDVESEPGHGSVFGFSLPKIS